MELPSPTSKHLVRRRSDTDLMPPPPLAKRLKRPKKVLNEDDYTSALSHIIARDFFPGIKVSEVQHEYLDAIESRNMAWISNAGRRLQEAMRSSNSNIESTCGQLQEGRRTLASCVRNAYKLLATMMVHDAPMCRTQMRLSEFQTRYTSEDNESFYKLLDRQNQKTAEKHAWMWNNNKLPSNQMVKQDDIRLKLAKNRNLIDDELKRDRLTFKDSDERPARPDTWKAAPRNGLMFEPEGLEDGVITIAQKCEESSRMPPRRVVYENTRIPQLYVPKRPPSPTMSSVRDAAAGRPRGRDQDRSLGDGTPEVNGYTFVDDDDEPAVAHSPAIALGSSVGRNPFKLQEQRRRESLHERLVERIAKSNKESSRHGLAGKSEIISKAPRFPSSPRIPGNFTPAAQRLIRKIGTPRRATSSPFDHSILYPKPRGLPLKPIAKLGSKRQG